MPTLLEKTTHHATNHIKLYKQGAFWVAYEQSAFFVAQLKGYKPTKKFYKNIKQNVVSVGFPVIDTLIKELTQNMCIKHIKKTDIRVEIELDKSINSIDFEFWKKNVAEKETTTTQKPSIEQLLKAFPLANKTPMDAFLFIKELQDLEQKSFQFQPQFSVVQPQLCHPQSCHAGSIPRKRVKRVNSEEIPPE